MRQDRVPASASFGARYSDFLYAAVGADADSGLAVSVLSALARHDVDPWETAESFARMPESAAVERLAAILKRVPCVASGREHPLLLARRLIALLPEGPTVTSATAPAAGAELLLDRVFARHAAATLDRVRRRPTVHYLFFYFMFIVFLICSQWLSPSAEQGPADGAAPTSEMRAPTVDPTDEARSGPSR
jgi:hypothetical protein